MALIVSFALLSGDSTFCHANPSFPQKRRLARQFSGSATLPTRSLASRKAPTPCVLHANSFQHPVTCYHLYRDTNFRQRQIAKIIRPFANEILVLLFCSSLSLPRLFAEHCGDHVEYRMCFSDESRAKASLVGLGASSEQTADTATEKSPIGQHGKRFTGQRARFPALGPRISQAERNRGLNTRGQIRYQRWAAVTAPHFQQPAQKQACICQKNRCAGVALRAYRPTAVSVAVRPR